MERTLFNYKNFWITYRPYYFGFYYHNNPKYLFASFGYIKIWWKK